jgi:ADP-ribosylglycohydrolase
MAVFALGDGDPSACIPFAANFGRDADTIGTMVGAMAGACRGSSALPEQWLAPLDRDTLQAERELAAGLCRVALQKADAERQAFDRLSSLVGT